MIKIGITGGICSGKTTMCKYLEELGYDVYYSDLAAIRLAENNNRLKRSLIKEFGEKAYLPDGTYNRKYIGGIVFTYRDQLDIINEIFRVYLYEDFNKYCQGKQLIIYESALIYEHGLQHMFDYIISIYAPDEVIIERLKKRNNFNEKEIKDRLNSQMDPLMKLLKSDYSINTCDIDANEQLVNIITSINKN